MLVERNIPPIGNILAFAQDFLCNFPDCMGSFDIDFLGTPSSNRKLDKLLLHCIYHHFDNQFHPKK